jgi:hypothetical protein
MGQRVRIRLSAFTRVEFVKEVEVDDATANNPQALQDLAQRVWDETDGGEFFDDTDYWEKGSIRAEVMEEGEDL